MSYIFNASLREIWYFSATAAILLTLTACQDVSSDGIGESEEVLRHQAHKNLSSKKYHAAIEPLTHLSNNYQVGANARVYRLELMHSLYKAKEFSRVVDTASDYIKIYPFEADVDYALYMKTLASLEEFKARHWVPKSTRERFGYTDTKILDDALVSANRLLATYPKSRYVPEVAFMASEIREIFMKKNYHIAKDYRARKAYAASQKRLTDVVVYTDSKPLLHESLQMMRDNYQSMNMHKDAEKINQIIQLNWG